MQYRKRKRDQARQRRAINPEKSRANERSYHAAHREQRREHSSRYRADNLEERRQKDRRYHAAHLDKARERVRRYRLTSPEKVRQRERVQKLRRRAAGKVTKEDLAQIWMAQNGCCAYCQHPQDSIYHVEHIRPISRGGTNALDNLCMSCPKCNLSKSTKAPDEWTNRWYDNQPDES